ncbi:MAG TPA: recombination protein RecR [Aquifex aeolicus]|uniref:Recombination protein RecR n=1 Tax=Aquifex aeolicus TaxID=63363 RepID=A0A9D0YNH6_AQUAO|nr:recombination protein RecR [Aquificales bacterium]HIP86042.1 recombination protein RecR [Aquifex sp.]HIP98046.1 recombination protein RecR [Aquifex aeolicus]HIQ26082.1 recombination protein RecR [Aquifex aeolicus]
MRFIPSEVEEALKSLQKIPGYGERGAQRFFYALLKLPPRERLSIVKVLAEAVKKLNPCKECGIYTDKDICDICTCPGRSKKLLTVVEESDDAYAIERLGRYKGVYHILGGRISPLEGISAEDLTINKLLERIEKYKTYEVILATNPNTEGEATASYLAHLLRRKFPDLKITRLGFGAAFGTYLDLLDEFSLSTALENRKKF